MKEYTGNHYFTSFSLVQFILNLVSFQVFSTTFSVFLPRCVGARPGGCPGGCPGGGGWAAWDD